MTQSPLLRKQLSLLVQIQELDLRIDTLEGKKEALPSQLKELDSKYFQLKKKRDEKQGKFDEFDKAKRQAEAAIELNQDRMDRANKKADDVNNTKEFQAASREIEQLKKLNETLTGQKAETDKKIEEVKKELDVIQEEFSKIETEKSEKMGVVSSQQSELDGDLGKLLGERDQVKVDVQPAMLMKYDRIRKARLGLGIVPADGGRCKGCNMMIPPQTYNELHRTDDMMQCPSCHRILFLPEKKEDSENS